ncbi:MAG TPA: lysophospholipid acyltransferase family protein [Longimicrobiaceae bacterium]|nr:lysophospholipid acyltransferase family protein [Longimicrobiaceae bacterium]
MIRTLWVGLAALGMTLYWGPVILFNAALKRRDDDWYCRATRSWAGAVIRASGCPVVIHGQEHVRPGVPQVIASNHVSWFDVFAIASTLEVPFHFVAKKELMRIPLFGRAMEAAGHIVIDRSNRERALDSLRAAGELIRHTPGAVVIFPEGTRSSTGRLQPFKKGAFMLAAEAGVPVVPAAVTGSFQIMPSGSWRIHRNTIHLHYLEPVHPEESPGLEPLMQRVWTAIAAVVEPEVMTLPEASASARAGEAAAPSPGE